MGQAQNDQSAAFPKGPVGAKGSLGGVKMKAENDANKIDGKINGNSCLPRAYRLIGDMVCTHENALRHRYNNCK